VNTKRIGTVTYVQKPEAERSSCEGCVASAASSEGLCARLSDCFGEDGGPGRIWVVQKPSRTFDEALAELLAERDALKKRVAEVESHSAHIAGLYGRQIQEIALLRTFYARQDATSWEAVRQFDAKGPG